MTRLVPAFGRVFDLSSVADAERKPDETEEEWGRRLAGLMNEAEKGEWFEHLDRRKADKLLKERPEKMFRLAVRGMLPKNSLGRAQLGKLKVYAGETHPHEAQKPEIYEF